MISYGTSLEVESKMKLHARGNGNKWSEQLYNVSKNTEKSKKKYSDVYFIFLSEFEEIKQS